MGRTNRYLFLPLLIGLLLFPALVFAQEYLVVAHSSRQEPLGEDQLLQILKREYRHWNNGANIIIYLPKNRKIQEALFEQLGTTKQRTDEYYQLLREQGKRIHPPRKQRLSSIHRLIKRNKNAIGVIKKSENQNFRILFSFST